MKKAMHHLRENEMLKGASFEDLEDLISGKNDRSLSLPLKMIFASGIDNPRDIKFIDDKPNILGFWARFFEGRPMHEFAKACNFHQCDCDSLSIDVTKMIDVVVNSPLSQSFRSETIPRELLALTSSLLHPDDSSTLKRRDALIRSWITPLYEKVVERANRLFERS
jgi:hypothetical protein